MDLLFESKQQIINLGFPPVLASWFYQTFGQNHAFMFAKWAESISDMSKFRQLNVEYNKVASGYEEYAKYIKWYYEVKPVGEEEFNQQERLNNLRLRMVALLDYFMSTQIVKAFLSGEIPRIKEYAHLSFHDANAEYNKKQIFSTMKPLVEYPNGWRWINVGYKCPYVGKMMSNCGSSGVNRDSDAIMIVLFDENQKPHVIVSYSPSTKRMSNVQGGASSRIKDEYIDYLFNLVTALDANLDVYSGGNNGLVTLRWLLGTPLVKRITPNDTYSEFFLFKIGKQEYITNGVDVLTKEDFRKIQFKGIVKPLPKTLKSRLIDAFNYYNIPKIKSNQSDIVYKQLKDFTVK